MAHSSRSSALRRASPGVFDATLDDALRSCADRRAHRLSPRRRGMRAARQARAGLRLVTPPSARRCTIHAPTGSKAARRCGPKARIASAKRPPLGKERRPQGGDWARSPTEEVPSSYCQNPTALCWVVYADSCTQLGDTTQASPHCMCTRNLTCRTGLCRARCALNPWPARQCGADMQALQKDASTGDVAQQPIRHRLAGRIRDQMQVDVGRDRLGACTATEMPLSEPLPSMPALYSKRKSVTLGGDRGAYLLMCARCATQTFAPDPMNMRA